MARKVVTVDIDSVAIRILETDGHRVVRWASAALEPGLAGDGLLPQPSALGGRVRQLMAASGIKGRQVIASLSGAYSVCRLLTIPQNTGDGAASSVPGLVQEAVPGEGMRLQYQLMEPDALGQRVLVLGSPAASVEAQLGVLRSAGLAPRALELKGMALARAVDRSDALIANLEPGSLDVALVSNGMLQVMRTLTLPPGLRPEARAGYVAQVLRQTVGFYNGQNPEGPLAPDTPLILVGPGLAGQPVADEVQSQLDYPLERFAPPLECPPHLPLGDYAVNLGLALRGLPQTPRPEGEKGAPSLHINLVVPRRPWWRPTPLRATALGGVVAGIAILYLLNGQVGEERGKTQELQARLTPIEAAVKLRQAELNRITQMEATIRQFKGLTAPWGHVSEVVAMLEGLRTPGVTLSRVGVERDQVGLGASAGTVEQAMDFVEALRRSRRFPEVPYRRTSTEVSGSFKLLPPHK